MFSVLAVNLKEPDDMEDLPTMESTVIINLKENRIEA